MHKSAGRIGMARLTVGGRMPDFSFSTPFEKGRSLAETVKKVRGKTAIIFLRYYGCPLCQFDIHQFAVSYDKIRRTDGQILVVLQSESDGLAGQMEKGDLPFDIICDPRQELYRLFEIKPAGSKEELVDEKSREKILAAKEAGFSHGKYEGEEMQLPAIFITDNQRKLIYVHYGKSIGDILLPEELAETMA